MFASEQDRPAIARRREQWRKYQEHVEKAKKQLDTLATTIDDLNGTRRRALERPLDQLESLRRERHIEAAESADTDLAALGSVSSH